MIRNVAFIYLFLDVTCQKWRCLQVPPCLLSNLFWLFTQILAPDGAQAEGRERCSFAQPDTRGPPSLPLTLPPSLRSCSWKNAQIRAWVGRRRGRKERRMERREKLAKDLGDLFNAKMLNEAVLDLPQRRMVAGACVLWVEVELAAVGLGTLLSHQCVSTGEGGPGWCCAHSFLFSLLTF